MRRAGVATRLVQGGREAQDFFLARWTSLATMREKEGDRGLLEVLDVVERWRAEGQPVALATVVAVEKSAPRDPGAVMAVNARGDVAGSVSGGCVESAVYQEAQDALASGRARVVTYGISDEQAFEHGLTCGGTIHVFVEPLAW